MPVETSENTSEMRRSPRKVEKPIKIQKYFDAGWFEGEVTKSRIDEAGDTLYFIEYEDGDREEVDDDELKILVEHYKNDRKNNAIYIDYFVDWNNEAEDPIESLTGSPQKKQKHTRGRKARCTKKKDKHGPPHSSQDSSLWKTLDPIGGEPVTRELIINLVNNNPPPTKKLPDGLQSRLPEMVEFFVLMRERQLIRNGKQTNCQILKDYHFCNNYRELDRGTAYLRSEILRVLQPDIIPMTRQQYTAEVLGMSYYYRQCNLIESFTNPDNPAGGIPRLGEFDATFVKYVKSFNNKDDCFFTSAHLNQGYERYIGNCKSSEAMIRKVANDITSMNQFKIEQVCAYLRQLDGIGSFMCWQIACDLEEACCFGPKLVAQQSLSGENKLTDIDLKLDYCVLGPGAMKGLNAVYGPDIFGLVPPSKRFGLACYLLDNMEYCYGLIGKDFPLWNSRKVNIKVIEHVLCEFQKFTQIDAGETGGQRKWHSRAHMDERPVCCQDKGIVRCDTCHLIVCTGCHGDKFWSIRDVGGGGCSCCLRCHALDQLILVD